MPPLKYTPVTPGLTEAVTGTTLNLKEQTLEWLEIRKNDTAPDGRFVFRPDIYDGKSSETISIATVDRDKYTVFSRKIDLSDNGKVTTIVSRENADAETAFGMKIKKQALQDWLKDEGFQSPEFRGIPHSWYNDTEVATAIDAMFTYSTGDWMVTERHRGKWPYKSIDDLKAKIDADPFLHKEGAHIVLMHDQDELLDVGIALVDHLIAKGFVFQKIP